MSMHIEILRRLFGRGVLHKCDYRCSTPVFDNPCRWCSLDTPHPVKRLFLALHSVSCLAPPLSMTHLPCQWQGGGVQRVSAVWSSVLSALAWKAYRPLNQKGKCNSFFVSGPSSTTPPRKIRGSHWDWLPRHWAPWTLYAAPYPTNDIWYIHSLSPLVLGFNPIQDAPPLFFGLF